MATKVKAVPVTKSARFRTLLGTGMTIAEAARQCGMGYAFAYGVAKRAGLAESAAKRRPEAHSKDIDLVQAVTKWARPRAAKAVKAYYEAKAS
jgi:transposase